MGGERTNAKVSTKFRVAMLVEAWTERQRRLSPSPPWTGLEGRSCAVRAVCPGGLAVDARAVDVRWA
jgi:hypothetical protein